MIHFTRHAEIQLRERRIPKALVVSVLLAPESTTIDGRGRPVAQCLVHLRGGWYVLRVVHVNEGEDKRVLTVYYSSKFRKYR